MDPTVQGVEEDTATTDADLCAFELIRDTMDSFAEASRAFAEGLDDPSGGASAIGRSFSSAIYANGVLLEQLSEVASRFDPTRLGRPVARTRRAYRAGSGAAAHDTEERATAASRTAEPGKSVVLAGAPGTEAVGAFTLENMRPEPIHATVLATAFVNLAGDTVPVAIQLEPARVVLEPGEEVVVRVVATIPAGLAPAEELHGAIHVPGLTASVVPLVVRSALPPA